MTGAVVSDGVVFCSPMATVPLTVVNSGASPENEANFLRVGSSVKETSLELPVAPTTSKVTEKMVSPSATVASAARICS